MLVEFHMIQNHAPSNLNRDDTGSPKECTFAGVKRARISSQCIKRSIRRSAIFGAEIQGLPLGMRTRKLPDQVKAGMLKAGQSQDRADIAAVKVTGFGTKEGKERPEEGNTAQTMFITDKDIDAIVQVLVEASKNAKTTKDFEKLPAKDIQGSPQLKDWRPITIDIALFGRMITSPAFQDVSAAMQMAHAISTHKVDNEFDYFTAVDDLRGSGDDADADEMGADMIGDVEFNSACYYKYFSVNFEDLVNNLAGRNPDADSLAEARNAASSAVPAFLKAAIFTTPSGKQNTFAAHQLPDAVLVEVRPHPTPVSYANAFVEPARARGNKDLVADSIQKLAAHASQITHKFSLKSDARLWFTTKQVDSEWGTDIQVSVCETIDDLMKRLCDSIGGKGVKNG